MLTKIEVRNSQGGTLVLPMQGGYPYKIKEVTGLDPVKATVVTSSFAQLDGSQFQSVKAENRNITMRLGMDVTGGPDFVAYQRDNLYPYFMPKSTVTLAFYINDVPTYMIEGIVESFDAPLFTSKPEANISILCLEPDFLATDTVYLSGFTVSDTTDMSIPYYGSVSAGFILMVHVDRDCDGITIVSKRGYDDAQYMQIEAPSVAGDTIVVHTENRMKAAEIFRSGVPYSSLLYGVSSVSTWPRLGKEENLFRVQCSGEPMAYDLSYQSRFGGM